MKIPEINKRIKQIIDYYTNGVVKKFAESIEIQQQTLNRLFVIDKRTGKYPVATTDILQKISEMYDIDANWLLTGQGRMLRNNQKMGDISNSTVIGSNVNGNGHTIQQTIPPEVITENSKNCMEIIRKQQEQIDKLIEVINKLSK